MTYEIGESFKVTDELTDDPYEITVKKIWNEASDQHKDYLKDVDQLADNANLTFITYTVKNLGDESISLFNSIPEFYANDTTSGQVDISYPDNGFKKEEKDPRDFEIKPNDTVEVTGVHDSTTYSKNTAAFTWEATKKDDKPIVLQTSIKKRKDAPGTYKQGEPIQILDETEDRQLVATIDNIELKDETDIEKDYDNSSWFVMDIKAENKGKQEINVQEAYPDLVVDDKLRANSRADFFKVGDHLIEQTSENDQAIIAPGEKLEGTLYINVLNKYAKDMELYYMDKGLTTNIDFAQKLDYNPAH